MRLKDLAAALGVSQTTVSRALNGHSDVSEATRMRVMAAAKRFGYTANENARRLATGRTGAVAIVFRGASTFGTGTLEFIAGLGERFSRTDVGVLVSTVPDAAAELDFYRRAAASKRVDGVILQAPTADDERVKLLLDLGLPFVLHGRTDVGRRHAFLDIDNEGAFRRATEHLLDLGHRRIALVNGPAGLTFAEHREKGFRDAMAARGVAVQPQWVANGQFSDEIGFTLAQPMLEQTPRPTAFLASSITTVLGIMRALRTAGLVIGRDVSVIAHDDDFPFLNADNMVPSLSTTRSPIRAAGLRIAEFMLQMLAGRAAEDLHEIWPVELVLRETTAPPPAG
jgi:LacI family transcriptional regulator